MQLVLTEELRCPHRGPHVAKSTTMWNWVKSTPAAATRDSLGAAWLTLNLQDPEIFRTSRGLAYGSRGRADFTWPLCPSKHV